MYYMYRWRGTVLHNSFCTKLGYGCSVLPPNVQFATFQSVGSSSVLSVNMMSVQSVSLTLTSTTTERGSVCMDYGPRYWRCMRNRNMKWRRKKRRRISLNYNVSLERPQVHVHCSLPDPVELGNKGNSYITLEYRGTI